MVMPKVTYSINGFRRNLAETLQELRLIIQDVSNDIDDDDLERMNDTFNELACSSNSFNCVHINGFEDFDDLSKDPEIELLD